MGSGEEEGKETAPAAHPRPTVYPLGIQLEEKPKMTALETW